MPLFQQENCHGGGGTSMESRRHLAENRRSLADVLGLNSFDQGTAVPSSLPNGVAGGDTMFGWRAGGPSSPEAAHTPGAHVPQKCFPPKHPTAYTSYSESAHPRASWSDDGSSTGQPTVTDLVASLALAVPSSNKPNYRHSFSQASIHLHLSYEGENSMESHFIENLKNSEKSFSSGDEKPRLLNRRASFTGGVQPFLRNGETTPRWQGTLPPREVDPEGAMSPKVFLGGLPWDITEEGLLQALSQFEPVRVEWPGREEGRPAPRGYAYVTLSSERRVRSLLAACRMKHNDWYYRLMWDNTRAKEVQVIPWWWCEAAWWAYGFTRPEPARTVFVGALHGMLSAKALAGIMNDVFGGVIYAGIDTDKNKYPIGSGRVTFDNVRSYVRAVSAGYVEICTDKFNKKVQVDPYLEDSICSACQVHQGPYFCREPTCFRYYCRACWAVAHSVTAHRPLTRCGKASGLTPDPYEGTSPLPLPVGPEHPDADACSVVGRY